MARFTSGGGIRFSGTGMTGFQRAWNELGDTVSHTLPNYYRRALAARGSLNGGGQMGHGQKWEDGWFAGRDNATAAAEKALGMPHAKVDDPPAKGTKQREGYDAALAAATVAVLGIIPD